MVSDHSDLGLELKTVGKIFSDGGRFIVPSYQRGYRWGRDNVEKLLEDVRTFGEEKEETGKEKKEPEKEEEQTGKEEEQTGKEEEQTGKEEEQTGKEEYYCLQPVVVSKNKNNDGSYSYELIDGQQRLTTLYLIYAYMDHKHKECDGQDSGDPFSLEYETRNESAEFLRDINKDRSRRDENIDFWFIANAYETIKEWFEKKGMKKRKKEEIEKEIGRRIDEIRGYLKDKVKIIWYEVEKDEKEGNDSLFIRLNSRIPLTNAELVKALFLCNTGKVESDSKSAEKTELVKDRIALQWDLIESELRDDSLWFFLTNNTDIPYRSRIDLILELVTECSHGNGYELNEYELFEKIWKEKRTRGSEELWRRIFSTFLKLKDWYEDHDIYHKVGYLIASGSPQTIHDIYNKSKDKRKTFISELGEHIKNSIKFEGIEYCDLNYVEHRKEIETLLLLHNVETLRQLRVQSQRFPFDEYKSIQWSLEHIYAKNSIKLNNPVKRKLWLRDCLPEVKDKELVDKINKFIDGPDNEDEEDPNFEKLKKRVEKAFSPGAKDIVEDDPLNYLNRVGNLALLDKNLNSELNDKLFDEKRKKVIRHKGRFIPYCTRNVFLKSYAKSSDRSPDRLIHLYFWGISDMRDYIEDINSVLKDYLPKGKTLESIKENQ